MAKIGVVSLGCSKNQIDCERMLSILDDAGHELTGDIAEVDAVIINTCGFINDAREESYENIREVVTLHNEGKVGKVIVTGCLAEREREKLFEKFPEISALCGCGSYSDILKALENDDGAVKPVYFAPPENEPLEGGRMVTTPEYTAFIKIAEGCDNHCAYCVIPKLRGRLRSRKPEDIVSEAESLVASGATELIIVAQDTGRYGMDLCGKSMLSELLTKLCAIEGVKWIRLHYLYPDKISDELIDVIANEEKIVKYLDIPIQHINNRILKAMNRRGNSEFLDDLFRKLRERIPNLVLRTSLIVGLPGETDEEFEELCDFVKKHKIERIGAFPYSREEGTRAAEMDGQVSEDEKMHRAELIGSLALRIIDEYNESLIGKELTVLCEGYDKFINMYFGRSYADSPDIDGKVFFKGEKGISVGDYVNVKITGELDGDVLGEAI